MRSCWQKRRVTWCVLAFYACLSIFYLGIPVALHPARDQIGYGVDPDLFVWSFGWWPHAILHWENPIVTHVIWAPEGYNLAWAAISPGLALLASPLTLAAGPVFAYNVVAVATPALAAWTAYLLCRYVTRSFWPSLVGGYLFGFSAYEFGQTEGHMQMTSVFLLPLVALTILRYLDGSRSARRSVLWLGVLLALQFSFSTEVSLTLATTIIVGLAVAYWAVPRLRQRLRGVPLVLGGACLLAAAIDSPLLIYALLHIQHGSINNPRGFNADLLNIIVPTRLTWIGWGWTRHLAASFQGNPSEQGAYLGLPTLAMLAWFAWEKRRQAAARFLIVMILIGVLAELGTAFHVEGVSEFTLPWNWVAKLPFYNNLLPVRFSGFVTLGAAVTVALWAASSRAPRRLRIALPVLAVAAVLPSLWSSVWHRDATRVGFFADGTYKSCLRPDDVVLMLPSPAWNDSMLWQAQAGYSFRMAMGYLSSVVPANAPDASYANSLADNDPGPDWQPLIQYAKAAGVTMIVVPDASSGTWTTLLAPVTTPTHLGGVWLYSLRPNGRSACTSGSPA